MDLESYATVLAAHWYQQRYALLDISVGLSNRVTTLRLDLSPTALVITQEDPRYPALLIKQGRFFYNCYETELRMSFEQAKKVALPQSERRPLDDEPTVDQARSLLAALGLGLDDSFLDAEVRHIIEKAIHAVNPYA